LLKAPNDNNVPKRKNIDPIQEMNRLIQSSSLITSWKFKESFRSPTGKRLIYDSTHIPHPMGQENNNFGQLYRTGAGFGCVPDAG